MVENRRHGRINFRLIIILAVALVVLAGAAFGVRSLRRSVRTARALQAGLAAYDRQDWASACENLARYLRRNPEDIDVLEKYAESQLSVWPLETANVFRAVGAYRSMMRLSPTDAPAYEKLAMLYTGVGDFNELAYIARVRLKYAPSDADATIWLGEALIRLRKNDEASRTLLELIERLELAGGKHSQYVRGCTMMADIAMSLVAELDRARGEAMKWLDRAVKHDPNSFEARVCRARFYRISPGLAKMTGDEKISAARSDLKRANELGSDDPRLRLELSREWTAWGELELADAQLQIADKLAKEAMKEFFFDANEWATLRFLQAAELAIRAKRPQEAVELADQTLGVLKARWHRVEALPHAIRLYVAVGRLADARKYLDEYLIVLSGDGAKIQADWEVTELRSLVALGEDRPYVVIDLLQPAVTGGTSRVVFWRMLAHAFTRTGQTRRAVAALGQYLRIHPRDPQMTRQLAQEYLKLQDWNRAFEAARLAEPMDPTNVIIKLLRIEAGGHLAGGIGDRINQARLEVLDKELASLRGDHPRRVDVRILQAIVAVYRNQPDLAEKQLKLAVEQCDEPLEAEMQLVRLYFRTKRLAEAIEYCQASCERHGEAVEPWLALSGLYASSRDYEAARNTLRTALRKITDRWRKRALTIRLAMLELLHGERSVGIELLRGLADAGKRDVRARSLLLSVREVLEDRALAEQLIDEMRQAEGQSGLLWRLRQAAFLMAGDDWRSHQPQIVELLQRCIDSDPEWAAPALLLSQMYERVGDLVRAEEICRRALSHNPGGSQVAERLVSLLEKQGRITDAQDVLTQMQANDRMASSWRVRLALRASDFSRAIDELKLRISNDPQDADALVLLARLQYLQTRDGEAALDYLRRAQAIAPKSMALTAAWVYILTAEDRGDEAIAILDKQVQQEASFTAYLMRGVYLVGAGKDELAEKDYLKLTAFAESGAESYRLLSRFYSGRGRIDDAVAALDEGVKAHGDDPAIRRELMKALLASNGDEDRQRAMEILSDLEARLPDDPDLMLLRATELLRQPSAQSTQQAREILKRVVLLEPTSIAAHVSLFEIAMREGEFINARDFAIRGAGANPREISLILARARAELALDNPQMAAQLAYIALRHRPGDANARDLLVEAALLGGNNGDLQNALALVNEGIRSDSTDDRLQLARALILIATGQTDAALIELIAFCKTDAGSESVIAIVSLGELYRLRGDFAAAGIQIERAEELAPGDPAVIRARLIWLGAQKRFDEISELIEAYHSNKVGSRDVILTAAGILATAQDIEAKRKALELYYHLTNIAPDLWAAHVGLASMSYQTGDPERAENIYRDVLKQDPGNIKALNDLAWILQEHRHQYEAALKLADKGLLLASDDKNLLDTRGTILSHLPGRLGDAGKDFARLVELTEAGSAARARALLQLGRICVRLKDFDQAQGHLKEAVEIDRKIGVFTTEERSEIERILDKQISGIRLKAIVGAQS